MSLPSKSKDIIYNYNVLSHISYLDNQTCLRTFKKFMNSEINLDKDKIHEKFYADEEDNKLLWALRKYDNFTRSFIDNLDVLEMKFKSVIFFAVSCI